MIIYDSLGLVCVLRLFFFHFVFVSSFKSCFRFFRMLVQFLLYSLHYDYFVYAQNNCMQLEKSMEKWGACSQSVKTIKMEDFPNASLFLLYHQTKKQLVPALHCFSQQKERNNIQRN